MLGKYRGAIEMCGIKIASFSPVQGVRIAAITLLGGKVGTGSVIYHNLEVRNPRGLRIGSNTSIGDGCTLDARGGLSVGKCVNLSTGVQVWTMQHDYREPRFKTIAKPTRIEDYAWVSARSIILPGVNIGRGAVVAAGAIVVRDVPPLDVVAGNPAHHVRWRPDVFDYLPAERKKKLPWW